MIDITIRPFFYPPVLPFASQRRALRAARSRQRKAARSSQRQQRIKSVDRSMHAMTCGAPHRIDIDLEISHAFDPVGRTWRGQGHP
ncbi:hypothetical protein SB781_35820, partial [Paraburkholderia sp. SIMBA_061]